MAPFQQMYIIFKGSFNKSSQWFELRKPQVEEVCNCFTPKVYFLVKNIIRSSGRIATLDPLVDCNCSIMHNLAEQGERKDLPMLKFNKEYIFPTTGF